MKFSIMLTGAMSLALSSFAQSESTAYRINGNLSGVTSGKIYLGISDDGFQVKDSAKVENGQFTLTGSIASPMYYYLKLGSREDGLGFVLEPGVTNIEGSAHIAGAKVTGSKMTEKYGEWRKIWMRLSDKAGALYQRLESLQNEGNSEGAATIKKEVDEGFKNLDAEVRREVVAFVKKDPNSPVSAMVVYENWVTMSLDPQMTAEATKSLGPDAWKSEYGKLIKLSYKQADRTKIGASPSFAMPDKNGKMIKTQDFAGRFLLVDFWASWCGPCRKENPNLVKAYAVYHSKGFEILSVSLDDKKDSWLKAITADGLGWTHVSDLKAWKCPLVEEYGIKSIPMNFLLDHNGKVIARDLRGEELEKFLSKLLGS